MAAAAKERWDGAIRGCFPLTPGPLGCPQQPPLESRVALTDILQLLIAFPEQGKGAQHQLPMQLPVGAVVRKGDPLLVV